MRASRPATPSRMESLNSRKKIIDRCRCPASACKLEFCNGHPLGFPLNGFVSMQMISGQVAAIAVTAIYGIWRLYAQSHFQRQRTLRERVALMLWEVASRIE